MVKNIYINFHLEKEFIGCLVNLILIEVGPEQSLALYYLEKEL